jgi:hypothetical protein
MSLLKIPELVIRGRELGAIFVLEPKTGGWIGANELGWVTQFDGQGAHFKTATQQQSILKLPEWGPPVVWTMSLAIEISNVPTNMLVECVANILFGSGGSTQFVQVDWQNGTVLSLPMNAVSVQAQYTGTNLPTQLPDTVRLSAQIARGTRGGCLPPQRTLVDGADAGGYTSFVPIPPFARQVDVTARDGAASIVDDLYLTGGDLEFWSGNNVGAVLCQLVGADRLIEFAGNGGVPIPASARFVRAHLSPLASGHVNMNFIFKIGM